MITIICLVLAGSLVVVLISFFVCIVRYRQAFADAPDDFRPESIPYFVRLKGLIEVFLTAMLRGVSWFIGSTWISTTGFVRLALAYWITLPSICILLLPIDARHVKESYLLVIALHLWIWANVLGDYISLHTTRYGILRYRRQANPTAGFLLRLAFVNVAVATSMMLVVIFFTNVAYLIEISQSWPEMRDQFVKIVFNPTTITRHFAPISAGKPTSSGLPGMLLVAAITYLPTASCVVLFMLGSIVTALRGPAVIVHRIAGWKDPRRASIFLQVIGVGMSAAGVAGACAYYIWQMTRLVK